MWQFLRSACTLVREKPPVGEEKGCHDAKQCTSTLLTQSCQKVAAMLRTQEEESIQKGCLSFFQELWFQDSSKAPTHGDQKVAASLARRAEELLETINVCAQNGSGENAGIEWLEVCVSNASDDVCAQYVSILVQSVLHIHNLQETSPFSLDRPRRPSEFNDFESRSTQLLPVVRALAAFTKTKPHLLKVCLQFTLMIVTKNAAEIMLENVVDTCLSRTSSWHNKLNITSHGRTNKCCCVASGQALDASAYFGRKRTRSQTSGRLAGCSLRHRERPLQPRERTGGSRARLVCSFPYWSLQALRSQEVDQHG
jgi:hypothetical protein